MKKKLKRKRILYDKFSYSNRNTNIFLVCTLLILLFCLTIGYSILSNVLSIKGDIVVRPTKDIRITNITGPVIANGAYENTNFRFSHNLLQVNGVLPNNNSSLTYTITIKNNRTSDMNLTDIINTCNNSNIYYELSGINLGDTIEAGKRITFTLTLKTRSGSNTAFNSQLQFIFEESYMDITSPTITFNPEPSNACHSSSYKVNIKATDDIEVTSFLWCQTTGNNSSCTPTTSANPVGTSINIDADSDYHVICVQASDSSKYGPNVSLKCSNENSKYYKLDTKGPNITSTITPSSPNGNNGWYKTLPVVKISGSDLGCSNYTGYKYQTSINGGSYSSLSSLQTNDNSLNSVITNNECKTIQYKVTGYDGNNNSSSTYTSNSFKYDKTAPVITVDGHTSDYSVEYEIAPVILENGTEVYYNPVSGTSCSSRDYSSSNITSGCMKWYAFNVNDNFDTVDLLLDHNTSTGFWSDTGDNYNGPINLLELLNSNTSGWSNSLVRTDTYFDNVGYRINYSGYKARLVTARELAQLVGEASWDPDSVNTLYLTTYPWLYSGGGYWTATSTTVNYSRAFSVDESGSVYLNGIETDLGVRPVITVNRDSIKSSYTVPTGTATDNCGGSVNVTTSGSVNTDVPGSYPIVYTATDSVGNTTALTLTVKIKDIIPPIITVDGHTTDYTIEVSQGSGTFTLPTGTATDDSGEAITVATSGSVNTNIVGSYEVKYMATDSSGNSTVLILTVKVVASSYNVTGVCGDNCDYISSKNEVKSGSSVTLILQSPSFAMSEYNFDACSFTNTNSGASVSINYTEQCDIYSYMECKITFTMPSYPVTVTCSFY